MNVRSLECLKHLEYLNLEKIRIDFISLYSLSNLRKLILSNLQTMSHLSWKAYEDAFKDLINLEYLKCVSEQQDTHFSFKLDHLSNLKWLQIENLEIDQNLISSIKSPKICVLKISNCRSKEKIFIEKIPSLKVLDLSCFVNFNRKHEKSQILKDLNRLEELVLVVNEPNDLNSLMSENLDGDDYLPKLNRLELNFKINNLTSLPAHVFSHLKHLKSLNLNILTQDNLQNRLFSSLKFHLEELQIKGRIKQIKGDFFEGLAGLKKLKLTYNQIEEVSCDAFSPVKQLEEIEITWNRLQLLKQGLFSSLNQLKILNLSCNKIEILNNGTFSDLSSLEYLDLSQNGIKTIEEYAFKGLDNLKKLNLSRNKIDRIDINGVNGQLKELSLGFNKIEILNDDTFSNLCCLEYLNLEENKIKEIKINVFKGLDNLKILKLNNNQIEDLRPDTFVHLKQLEELDLSGNLIQILLEGVFSQINSLKKLGLRMNRIETIEINFFGNLGYLRELDLRNNDSGEIIGFSNAILKLNRLEKLRVDHFDLTNLDKEKELENFFGKTLSYS